MIKQNQLEVGNIDFKIEPNKAKNVFLFPIVFGILQLLISLEPIDQFQWGFLQNVALKMVHTVNKKNGKLNLTDFRLILLDHITYDDTINHYFEVVYFRPILKMKFFIFEEHCF